MNPTHDLIQQTRRQFLASSASGVGGLALASMLAREAGAQRSDPLAPKAGHHSGKAKACIFIYLAGAPSQIDLFTPKPKLKELDGQQLPAKLTDGVRFAFINKNAKVKSSTRAFKQHGQSGMHFSELLPHISTCADDICMINSMKTEAFNHHPGQLMMNCGTQMFGQPSIGSWVNYGLGSVSENLPGYVVLTAGQAARGGATNWSSGFLPSTYQGVLFRNQGEPVLNLENPAGINRQVQRQSLDLMKDLISEFGMGVLFITHDLSVIAQTADRVAVMYLGRIVEEGPVRQVIGDPRHPYTQGLIKALPRIGGKGELTPISGDIPSPLQRPGGCVFHPRCSQVFGPCAAEIPSSVEISDGHSAACHLYLDGDRK